MNAVESFNRQISCPDPSFRVSKNDNVPVNVLEAFQQQMAGPDLTTGMNIKDNTYMNAIGPFDRQMSCPDASAEQANGFINCFINFDRQQSAPATCGIHDDIYAWDTPSPSEGDSHEWSNMQDMKASNYVSIRLMEHLANFAGT